MDRLHILVELAKIERARVPTYTIHQAKTRLSDLIRRVEAGEEVIIARGKNPVAELRRHDRNETASVRLAGRDKLAQSAPCPPDAAFFGPASREDLVEMFGEDYVSLHEQRKASRE